jgi:hypothetical protein
LGLTLKKNKFLTKQKQGQYIAEDRLSTPTRCLGLTSKKNKFLTKQKQEQYIAEDRLSTPTRCLGLGAYFKEKQVLNQTKTRTIHC